MARRALKDFLHTHAADPRTLADVLLAVSEVVTNCVVHAYRDQPTGRVALEAERSGDELMLSVTDRGHGMAPRTDSPGLGLGLPLVGRIAPPRRHHRPGRRRDARSMYFSLRR